MNAFWLREAAVRVTGHQAPLCNKNGDIRFRVADDMDLETLDALNEEVIRALGVPGRFMRQDKPFFEGLMLCPDACIFIATQNGTPVAYSIAARACDEIPAFDETTNAKSIGLLFGTAVDPPLRGQGIQRIMISLRIESLRRIGCKTAQTTVAPLNRHSLINLMDTGFRVVGLKKILDGHHRFIMERPAGFVDLSEAVAREDDTQKTLDLCEECEIENHETILKEGWVGTGYAGDHTAGKMQIFYVNE